jgi:glycosyltransferase involved in cell wall biosynthesis
VCIPNWFDIGIAGAATEHGSRDEPIVVQYSGKMGSLHNDGLLLEAAEILLRRGVNARIEVRTWGRNARSFAEAVHTRGLSNVRFLEPCPRDQLEAQLSLCDVGLITMKKGTAGISVPCRIYNRLACARPVLAAVDADSEVARVIEESGAGVVIDPDDPTALADAISYFEVNRSSLPEMGRRGAVHVAARYSFETALERYRLIIDETANWSNPI